MKKLFVLDTNVVLHDSSSIYEFEDNDIVLPMTVIEEVDNFKKGGSSVNFHARKIIRTLDKLSTHKLFNGGSCLGEGKGNICIKLPVAYHNNITALYKTDTADNRILNLCYTLSLSNKNKKVILVSKDVNLRLKAQSLGIHVEDYNNDKVSTSILRETIEVCKNTIQTKDLYTKGLPIDITNKKFNTNQFLIIKNNNKHALAFCDSSISKIIGINSITAAGIRPRNVEQTFAFHAILNKNIKLVTITGKAGTGKTVIALAGGIEQRTNFHQILLTRPIVPLSNKDIGFLPGDIESKITPYMQPLYDNLNVIKRVHIENKKKINKMQDNSKIIVEPLTYIRGRSLIKKFVIVDEAQNLTPHEIKTIITRAGEDTKIILTGDIHQIDHPYLDSYTNGLSYLINKMKGQKIYAHVNLEKSERSELSEIAAMLL